VNTHRTRAASAALLLPLALVLAGCDQGAAHDVDPTQALATAKTHLDETEGVTLHLGTDKLPAGVSGLLDADGVATHAPAFQGDIKVATSGITAGVKVVAVDGAVYAVLPFTQHYTRIDPADYNAPDPAALMDPEHGLSSLLTEARDVTNGKKERDGDQVLSTYSGTVPGRTVAAIIPSADPGEDFDATFNIDDRERLHEAILTGPFYPQGGDVTYTIEFDDYGTAHAIKAP
jgi:lipoprotein LprG